MSRKDTEPLSDKGLDYSWGRPNVDTAWSLGYRFVCRYLSYLPNGKAIGATELAALRKKGFHVALNWEFDAHDALGGASAGTKHATEAVKQAKALGYPNGCTIYFSADFDELPNQAATVHAYMNAGKTIVRAAGFRMGIYGGYYTVKRALDAGCVDDAWQAYAWSGGNWDSRAALRQVRNGVEVAGADCDIDERVGQTYLMGQAVGTAPAPTPTTTATSTSVEEDNVNFQLSTPGQAVVVMNPAMASGKKTWLTLSSDFGDGTIRVAFKHYAKGWEVKTYKVGSAQDHVAVLLMDKTISKVSIRLEPGSKGVFCADLVQTGQNA